MKLIKRIFNWFKKKPKLSAELEFYAYDKDGKRTKVDSIPGLTVTFKKVK